MANRADAFAAPPGGFEVLTWAQLGLYAKPIGLLNIAGFSGAL
jgi:predicted Rossmann-fold nucleotide-binding protein